MKRLNLHGLLSLVIAAFMAILSGCSATGPIYQEVDSVPDGKALVYIYRPGKFMGGGVVFDVHAGNVEDDMAIVELRSGGYYPYFAQPGELQLWAKTESMTSLTLDINAGDRRYIKGTVGVGFLVGRPKLTEVDEQTGAREIKECVLLTPAED
ncbi:MAG: DUF2846 domain-containing protein [Gammaproteobacteria bacterium]|nr:MAG: DUF2846 domain-containing protein [Gammaproteobacteria bacterium]UCC55152.1 MAG: hypothetical protein JSU75_07125 [Gammaproteobacteria bacterium]